MFGHVKGAASWRIAKGREAGLSGVAIDSRFGTMMQSANGAGKAMMSKENFLTKVEAFARQSEPFRLAWLAELLRWAMVVFPSLLHRRAVPEPRPPEHSHLHTSSRMLQLSQVS